MAKHACIENNIVVKIIDIESEDHYQEEAREYLLVLNVEDVVPSPQVGWVFNGLSFTVPNAQNMSLAELDQLQQTSQRQFGQKLLPDLIDRMGARNLQLSRDQEDIDVVAIAGQMANIKLLLETGALKTARSICVMISPSFPLHADILDYGINQITSFLEANGFE